MANGEISGPPALNFYAMLSGLGDTIETNRKEATKRAAIQSAFTPGADGKVDFNKALMTLAPIDAQAASLVAQRQNHMDTLRQQEIQNARQSARDAQSDRQWVASYELQKQAAARAGDKTPAGFESDGAGGYRPIRGGPADPKYRREINVPDVPAGFQPVLGGGLKPIEGGPADPAYLRLKGDKQNAPSGYRWLNPEDPNAGMAPIPGGPGEKVDAEVAGRLGLAKSFLTQLPDIRKRVQAGEITGPVNATKAYGGIGGPGELRRQIDSGAEALLRMLTGAGMNNTEAAEYTRRYKFHPTDTSATLDSKITQLERELNSVGETVGKGRGGWQSPSATPRPSVAPKPSGQGNGADAMLGHAREALAAGAPRDAVLKRLQEAGIDPSGL